MPQRQITLDTETTGLEPADGHRVLEIGAVELVDRRPTGRQFHCYLNPQRPVDADAQRIHGLTEVFLADKPLFKDVARDFVEFVRGAELIIHNAAFDLGFLDAELSRLEWPPLAQYCPQVTDTLKLARELHPGQRNNLDALCRRYGIDNTTRLLHGALLDAQLLAEVYLAMTRGQDSLKMAPPAWANPVHARPVSLANPALHVLAASPAEQAAHEQYLDTLDALAKGPCLWRQPDRQ